MFLAAVKSTLVRRRGAAVRRSARRSAAIARASVAPSPNGMAHAGFSSLRFRAGWRHGKHGSRAMPSLLRRHGYAKDEARAFSAAGGPLSAASPPADGSAEVDAAGATMAQESAVADGISASAAQIPQIEGLDLGHWPSEYIIRMIQYLHEGVGLEWWAAIALTTVVLRSAMVPLAISSAGNAGRLSKMKPELDAVLARMKSDPLVEAGDTDRKMMYANEVKALQKLHNASPGRSFLPILVQMPVFMSFFFGLRRMAEEGFPSMASGGPDWSWFQDLTVADTTYAFPVLTAASFLLTVELGGEGADPEQMKKMKNVMRLLSVGMVPLTAGFPCAVFCYWFTSNIFSAVQTGILRIPSVRTRFGMPLLGTAGSAPGAATGNGSTAATMSMAQMNPFAAAQNAGAAHSNEEKPTLAPPTAKSPSTGGNDAGAKNEGTKRKRRVKKRSKMKR